VNELPAEITRLLGSMFAGHTGLSLKEIEAFFKAKGVQVTSYPGDAKPRRALLERTLNALPPRERLAAITSLLNFQGRMRHGYPTYADKARLREWLEDTSKP
jgi:hypothetical protein